MAFRGKALQAEAVRQSVQAEADLAGRVVAAREAVGEAGRAVAAVRVREARRKELPHCGERSA